MKLINLAGIGALLYLGFQWLAGRVSNLLTVGTIAAKNLKLNPTGLSFTLNLPVINDTGVSLPLESFNGVLRYGSYQLANLNMNNPITVAAGQTTVLQFDIVIPFAQLADSVVAIIQDQSWLNAAYVEGMIRASGLNIPIEQPIQVV
jgi:hypothetical protein